MEDYDKIRPCDLCWPHSSIIWPFLGYSFSFILIIYILGHQQIACFQRSLADFPANLGSAQQNIDGAVKLIDHECVNDIDESKTEELAKELVWNDSFMMIHQSYHPLLVHLFE